MRVARHIVAGPAKSSRAFRGLIQEIAKGYRRGRTGERKGNGMKRHGGMLVRQRRAVIDKLVGMTTRIVWTVDPGQLIGRRVGMLETRIYH